MGLIERVWSNRLVQQIFRFAIVGGLAFIIDFGLLIFLTEIVGIDYLISATISFIVSVIFNYILSVYWVFTARHKKPSLFMITAFFVLSTCGLFINNGIMWFSVEVLSISYVIGKLVATVVVMIFNFITRKILIEGRRQAKKEQQERELKEASDAAKAAEDAANKAALAASEAAEAAHRAAQKLRESADRLEKDNKAHHQDEATTPSTESSK